MRIVDREQAKCVAGFGSTTRANTRLLALTNARLLRRFFLGTTASGRKVLYSMSKRGADLVEVPYRGLRRGSDETLITDFFVTHQLLVNEIFCTAKYRPIPIPGVQFVQWRSFYKSMDAAIPLIPDGYVEVKTQAKTLAAFLEVDLGNESRSVWRAKIQSYLRYAVSGSFERQFAHPQFRTLVVANSKRRLQSLREATAELTDKIFWFTTFESITKLGFWSPIWNRPKDNQAQPLIGDLS
jgi:hypothetical protein